ncbi:calcium-binding protein P-like [Anguilla rostrata]|uniref:calcium-binding protein P-like n=1 Tax=Anguilla rostrata TaxID=7938 RepID=UPI0030CC10A8
MDDLGPLDFPPAYPGPPINDYGGMAGPSQPGFQGSPYPPFQPGPYQGGPVPGGYPATPQYYAGQPGPQQMGPVPGGYPATPQYYPGQPGPQQMGPVPGGYPATPQYYAGQPGPQQMGPAPGGYPDAHQDYTGQPGPQQTGPNVNVHIREFIREVHIQGPAPEGYPSASQYYPGQPGPQKMGPAPGASPQWATGEPQLENVDQCHVTTDDSKVDKKPADSDNCCKLCCLKTRKCLMSPECGRCLEIASVIAMCGMCFRFFI